MQRSESSQLSVSLLLINFCVIHSSLLLYYDFFFKVNLMVSLFQYFIYAICFKCFFFLALAFESVRAAFFFFFFDYAKCVQRCDVHCVIYRETKRLFNSEILLGE